MKLGGTELGSTEMGVGGAAREKAGSPKDQPSNLGGTSAES